MNTCSLHVIVSGGLETLLDECCMLLQTRVTAKLRCPLLCAEQVDLSSSTTLASFLRDTHARAAAADPASVAVALAQDAALFDTAAQGMARQQALTAAITGEPSTWHLPPLSEGHDKGIPIALQNNELLKCLFQDVVHGLRKQTRQLAVYVLASKTA